MKTTHMPDRVADNLNGSIQKLLNAYVRNIEAMDNIGPQNDPEGLLPEFLNILEQYVWLKGNTLHQIDITDNADHRKVVPSYFNILAQWVHHANSCTFAQWCADLSIPEELRP